ncbi:hypothetical protein Pan216_44200 [Planctomycetes bacterium Pan216]|uniref:Uncharacterized protein n=1 Tax=Kolteria novifilia TaxID=2527975 RepID=A0A518B981_9BACT|nr:hypothetical protein Pan216_44200 [Planctomycetes bacterium Pan216]
MTLEEWRDEERLHEERKFGIIFTLLIVSFPLLLLFLFKLASGLVIAYIVVAIIFLAVRWIIRSYRRRKDS